MSYYPERKCSCGSEMHLRHCNACKNCDKILCEKSIPIFKNVICDQCLKSYCIDCIKHGDEYSKRSFYTKCSQHDQDVLTTRKVLDKQTDSNRKRSRSPLEKKKALEKKKKDKKDDKKDDKNDDDDDDKEASEKEEEDEESEKKIKISNDDQKESEKEERRKIKRMIRTIEFESSIFNDCGIMVPGFILRVPGIDIQVFMQFLLDCIDKSTSASSSVSSKPSSSSSSLSSIPPMGSKKKSQERRTDKGYTDKGYEEREEEVKKQIKTIPQTAITQAIQLLDMKKVINSMYIESKELKKMCSILNMSKEMRDDLKTFDERRRTMMSSKRQKKKKNVNVKEMELERMNEYNRLVRREIRRVARCLMGMKEWWSNVTPAFRQLMNWITPPIHLVHPVVGTRSIIYDGEDSFLSKLSKSVYNIATNIPEYACVNLNKNRGCELKLQGNMESTSMVESKCDTITCINTNYDHDDDETQMISISICPRELLICEVLNNSPNNIYLKSIQRTIQILPVQRGDCDELHKSDSSSDSSSDEIKVTFINDPIPIMEDSLLVESKKGEQEKKETEKKKTTNGHVFATDLSVKGGSDSPALKMVSFKSPCIGQVQDQVRNLIAFRAAVAWCIPRSWNLLPGYSSSMMRHHMTNTVDVTDNDSTNNNPFSLLMSCSSSIEEEERYEEEEDHLDYGKYSEEKDDQDDDV